MDDNLKEWKRNCPDCGKGLIYSGYQTYWYANRKNSVCNSCKQIGKKNHFYGKHHTEEHKNHLSNKQSSLPYVYKNKSKDTFYEKIICLNCESELTCLKSRNRKFCSYGCAMQYRFKNEKSSIPENTVQKWLDEFCINHISQYELESRLFDFYLPEINTLIEIDGTYHHAKGIELFEDMDRIQKRTRYNDLIKDKIADKNKMLLLRVWHDEINKLYKIFKEAKCT